MSDHTPGPWTATVWPTVEATFNGRVHIVANCYGGELPPKQREANARLIAAAPELFAENERLKALNAEMLEAAKSFVALVEWGYSLKLGLPFGTTDRLIAAKKAVAKAEGK